MEMPDRSARAAAFSGRRPNAAQLPKSPMPKRAPSSSHQPTISTGRRKRTPSSSSESIASTAQSTPSAPSKRPPSGTESRWEPTTIAGPSPPNRATRFAAASRRTVAPRAASQAPTSSRAACSSRLRPSRVTLVPKPPIAESSAVRRSRRARSTLISAKGRPARGEQTEACDRDQRRERDGESRPEHDLNRQQRECQERADLRTVPEQPGGIGLQRAERSKQPEEDREH